MREVCCCEVVHFSFFLGHKYYGINNDGVISKINYAIVSMLV